MEISADLNEVIEGVVRGSVNTQNYELLNNLAIRLENGQVFDIIKYESTREIHSFEVNISEYYLDIAGFHRYQIVLLDPEDEFDDESENKRKFKVLSEKELYLPQVTIYNDNPFFELDKDYHLVDLVEKPLLKRGLCVDRIYDDNVMCSNGSYTHIVDMGNRDTFNLAPCLTFNLFVKDRPIKACSVLFSLSFKYVLGKKVVVRLLNIEQVEITHFDIVAKGHWQFETYRIMPDVLAEIEDVASYIQIEFENKSDIYLAMLAVSERPEKAHLTAPVIKYWIDRIENNTISGWIANIHKNQDKPRVIIESKNKHDYKIEYNIQRLDLASAGVSTKSGFLISWTHDKSDKIVLSANGSIKRYTVKLCAKSFVFDRLFKIQNELLATKENLTDEIRRTLLSFFSEAASKDIFYSLQEKITIPPVVTIVIPVYQGLKETKNCIESVLKSRNRIAQRIVIMNDCSPNLALSFYLEDVEEENKNVILISNDKNFGFVQSVNKGMKCFEKDDVILLNSDTEVPDGWVDALYESAYVDETIGTVTPFSNNATICSYPRFICDNGIDQYQTVNELANEFSKQPLQLVDLPTAHGFCMYIKRDLLNEIGYFDEEKWHKGYAEENEFSVRAYRHGWRNVVTSKTYVKHVGCISFQEDSHRFIQTNLQKLEALYPDYTYRVMQFIAEDPLRGIRNKVGLGYLQREAQSFKNNILFINLSIGGGTKIATDDLVVRLAKEGIGVFELMSSAKDHWELVSQFRDHRSIYHIKNSDEFEIFINDLKTLDIFHIHYHHDLQFSDKVWALPEELDVDYDMTIHDYYSICPRANFVDETELFCNEPSHEVCTRCLKKNGLHADSYFKGIEVNVDLWRKKYETRLKSARKVFVPSNDTKERLLKYFAISNIETIYHPEKNISKKINQFINPKKSLVALGALGPHKGINKLVELAAYIDRYDLPYTITVIGYTSRDNDLEQFSCVKMHGKYQRDELPQLIEKYRAQYCLLMSVWPETFSYTLSEAIANGCVPVVFDLGAQQERAKLIGVKIVLPLESSSSDIVTAIENMKGTNGVNNMQNDIKSISKDMYAFTA